jgi:hypothetical protein
MASYLTYQTSCLTSVLHKQTDASARASDAQLTSANAPQPVAAKATEGSNKHQDPTKVAKRCTILTTPAGASESS